MTDGHLPARSPGTKRRVTTCRDWILRGVLAPWMMQYAQWLAQQPGAELSVPGGRKRGHPTIAERQAVVNKMARRKIQIALVWMLEQRPDFASYFEKMRTDAVFLVKETLKQDLLLNVEARRVGLERASDLQIDEATGEPVRDAQGRRVYGPMLDVKEVRQYTEFIPQVAFPKQAPREDAAPRIVIHLGSKDAKALIERALGEPEIQDVEYEVIESEKPEPGPD